MDDTALYQIVRNSLLAELAKTGQKHVPVAVSNRHVHLCRSDVEKLFGAGYQLKPLRRLSQPGQFACQEKVLLLGPRGTIAGVRVLGPERKETQVEVSCTDSYTLGIKPVIRMSGELDGTPGLRLGGPMGAIDLAGGVIVGARHLHMSESEAAAYGLTNGDPVRIISAGPRRTILENVVVRSGKGHSLEVHIDTDEANAAGIQCGEILELVTGG